jgi:wyosine [tRNA(Phe)-imidazoG37] synthetase (radical SAM superfamily)
MSVIFGPIISRRFGVSLGVDLSPDFKQCNFDCLYCELQSSKTTMEYNGDLSVSQIINDIKDALNQHTDIEVITFTANGEPTLYPHLEQLVDEVNKIKGDKKTLILSNGANIYDIKIQKILTKIDIVKLSLDCVSLECFKKLDRANKQVKVDKIPQAIYEFSQIYQKTLIIEILFVKSLNDHPKEIKKLNDILVLIKPSRIDIGTIERPPAYDVKPLSYNELEKIALMFDIDVNITAKNDKKSIQSYTKEEILKLLRRRPLDETDINNLFDDETKQIFYKLLGNEIIQKDGYFKC